MPWAGRRSRWSSEGGAKALEQVGVRFARLDELIDLAKCGEVVPSLRCGGVGNQGATTGKR